ncbi:hypothetical protein ACJRO7_017708 [Eucalyptus globulus]|uniref:Uncharacterized protein n=1 Tax=Eucalyptus globulus TaxID=34317 RepID=A0ABD3KY03_EUCGL
MRPQILLVALFLAILPVLAIPAQIKDVQNVRIRRAAQLAVLEFNKKNSTCLIFKDYRLHLVTDQPSSPCYKSRVQVCFWLHVPLKILSFEGKAC